MGLRKLNSEGIEIGYFKISGNYSTTGIEFLAFESFNHRNETPVPWHPAVPIVFNCTNEVEILLGEVTPKVDAKTVLEVKKAALYTIVKNEIAAIIEKATQAGELTIIDTEKFNVLKTNYKDLFFNELEDY